MIPGAYDARGCAIFFPLLLHTFLCVNGSSVRALVCVCSRELLLIWPPSVGREQRKREREREGEGDWHNSLQFQCKFFAIKRACVYVCVCAYLHFS